jgi:predicted anti-sigma-YlaC factor YlaD
MGSLNNKKERAMNCETAQEVIQKLHQKDDIPQETNSNLSLDHLVICKSCQHWFHDNMCSMIQNTDNEDVQMLHSILHEPLGTECRIQQ